MTPKLILAFVASLLLLSGCATTEEMQRAQVKRITPEELASLIPSPIATYTLEELVADSKQGKSSDEIIEKIKQSESRYDLTTTQVIDLNKQGVDIKVLDFIQESNDLAKQNYIAEEINKAEKEKEDAIRRLKHEQIFQRYRYYNPFWYSRYGPYFHRRHFPISRFNWGLGIGW